MSLTSLKSVFGSFTRALRRTARSHPKRGKRPASRRLELEHLEARDLMAPMAMGMEVERPTSYMGSWMFTDAFQASTPWVRWNVDTTTGSWTANNSIPIDSSTGAPTQLRRSGPIVQTLTTSMFVGVGNHYPAGTYTAWWQGDGQVDFGGDVIVSSIVRGETTGSDGQQYHTATFNVAPGRTSTATREGQGITMTVTPTSDIQNNPIHNVHCWMPDYNGQSFVGQMWQPGASFSPFHPLFTERLAPFGTLRFMETMGTNESTVSHWSHRRPVNFISQVSGGAEDGLGGGYTVAAGFHQNGMAPEYMIALANQLNANIWINVPHLADPAEATSPLQSVRDNSYILQLANLVHNTLERDRHVYLEWSNEVWNSSFAAQNWIVSQTGGDETTPQFAQFVAQREAAAFNVFASVFSDRPGQLTRVLVGRQGIGFEGDTGTHDYNVRLLEAMRNVNPQTRQFDAFAVSAYLYAEPFRGNTSVARVLADMRAAMPDRIAEIRDGAALARQYNARFVSYEAGMMLQASNLGGVGSLPGGQTDAQRRRDVVEMNKACIHPGIYGVYRDFLRQVSATGLELYNNMQYTGRGTLDNPTSIGPIHEGGLWGALSYQDQPLSQAHKYRALLEFVAGTSTTVSANAATPVAGQTVTLTVRVEANAIRPEVVTGNVRFYDGATLLGTASVVNGMATFETTSLRVGGHALRAIYDGDTSYTGSRAALRLTVSRSAVDMTLISSAPESVFGQPITLTVQVAAAAPGSGTPTGVVTFRDGTTVLRTVRLVNGVATFTTSALRVGTRAISAVFSGDSRFLRASMDLTQTVSP